jgi:hypothetical protein
MTFIRSLENERQAEKARSRNKKGSDIAIEI